MEWVLVILISIVVGVVVSLAVNGIFYLCVWLKDFFEDRKRRRGWYRKKK